MLDLACFTRHYANLAEPAVAIAATVVERKPTAQTCFQNRFCAFDEKLVTTGNDGCLCGHNSQKCFVYKWLVDCTIVCRYAGGGFIDPGSQPLQRVGFAELLFDLSA